MKTRNSYPFAPKPIGDLAPPPPLTDITAEVVLVAVNVIKVREGVVSTTAGTSNVSSKPSYSTRMRLKDL